MAKGPEQQKLDRYVDDAHQGSVDLAAQEWRRCSGLLDSVQRSIESASSRAVELGGRTGPAASRAFDKSATAMGHKSRQLREGSQALSSASTAIAQGRAVRDSMGDPSPAPTAPQPSGPGPVTPKDLRAQGRYSSDLAAWNHEQQQREARAQRTTTDMDASFRDSTATMKKIHGEPDPEPGPAHRAPQGPSSTGGGGTPGGRTPAPADAGRPPTTSSGPAGTGHHPGSTGPGTTGPGSTGPGQHPGGTTQGGGTPGSSSTPSGTSQGSWTIPGSSGGPGGTGSTSTGPAGAPTPAVSMGAGAGITGGAGLIGGLAAGGVPTNLAGGVRGGLTAIPTGSASAASGVRPIGAGTRTGVSGALGRSGATPGTGGNGSAGSTGRSAGATGGSRRGAPGKGAAGGRGSAGGTGRGGDRSRDRSKRKGHEHLDEEWQVDDEDAAPAVLD